MGNANYEGLVIAGLGFFLTRFTVTLALYEDPLRFYLAGVVPLVLGLGLAAFGVALTVADVESRLVRTTTAWCVLGTVGMLVLVVLTLVGSRVGMSDPEAIRSQVYLSTFLIGGAVGGTFTGLYASRTRRHRAVSQQQANRLVVLNRMLRHEILNALTPIRGFGGADRGEAPEAERVITERADDIEAAVEQVSYLTKHAGDGGSVGVPTALGPRLTESIERVEERHPEATVEWEGLAEDVQVIANDRVERVFTQLLDNAVVHGQDPTPTVDVTTTGDTVRVRISDDGDGLPESRHRLLETGTIGEFDDPRMGYGLNVVRLLVESYGGRIETAPAEDGTAITVVLQRAVPTERPSGPSVLSEIPAGSPSLLVTFGASLLAGVCYGLLSEFLGGSVAGIGLFYGTADPVVGWLTHEFHSVVFGFVFTSLLSLAPARSLGRTPTYVAVGAGWGLVLWAGAAGVVAPLWLRLLGISAPLPNLTIEFLATHLLWGVTLGLFTAWGERYLAPQLPAVRTWWDRRAGRR